MPFAVPSNIIVLNSLLIGANNEVVKKIAAKMIERGTVICIHFLS